MKLKDIVMQAMTEPVVQRPRLQLFSSNPEVHELLCRWQADEEMDCLSLNAGDLALISAVVNEVLDNCNWEPTSHILALISNINARLAMWAKRQ